MSSPPALVATPDDRRPVSGGDASQRDAYLSLLIRDAREVDPALRDIGLRELLRIAREFADAKEADQEDLVGTIRRERSKPNPRVVVSDMSAYLVAVQEFRHFVGHRRRKLRASDPRRDGWRQR